MKAIGLLCFVGFLAIACHTVPPVVVPPDSFPISYFNVTVAETEPGTFGFAVSDPNGNFPNAVFPVPNLSNINGTYWIVVDGNNVSVGQLSLSDGTTSIDLCQDDFAAHCTATVITYGGKMTVLQLMANGQTILYNAQ